MLNLLEIFKGEKGFTKKKFGQHFLTNHAILDQIVAAAELKKGDAAIEIGPGCGVLTIRILETDANLTAIEIDRDLAGFLTRYLHYKKNFSIINSDVKKVDFNEIGGDDGVTIIGNLPYNVSVRILEHCTTYIHRIKRMVFMFQKEVADRINAEHGSRTYSSLSVYARYFYTMKKVRDIGGGNFWPKANVMSTVVTFVPREGRELSGQQEINFLKLVRDSFSMKRKTLRNNLSHIENIEEIIEAAGFKPTIRGEELSVADFLELYKHAESKNAFA